jgi:hydroxymethylbilane synthase
MDPMIRVATRGGALAMAQTQIIAGLLRQSWPNLDLRIEVITTQGDLDQRTALWDLRNAAGTEGFFTTQLEQALLADQADVAVHSLKDLPTRQAEGLAMAAVCQRQFPEDCLVARGGVRSLAGLAGDARIGTSSLRRAAQVRRERPELRVVPIRGNVETRLAKLDDGQVDAVILARAGLERLGLAGRISAVLDPSRFIPAPAQGALAVQVRAADEKACRIVSAVDDPVARTLVEAERQILVSTGCGCHAPVGAFAEIVGRQVRVHAFLAHPDARGLVRRRIEGPVEQSQALARQIADDLMKGP